MPKRPLIWPNERIDLPDFNRAATEFTEENDAFFVEKAIADLRARVLAGFRVEIADQTTNPGQITVYNGFAVDRDGKMVNDEDQPNDSRTITLTGASQFFYVEVEYVTVPSDSDARAFWDPTYDQTSPIPDGAEFALNVATRNTPTWRIVTPVSTSAFAVTADPNSLKIPVIRLHTNGSNEILAADPQNAGLTQVVASTILEEDVVATAASIRVLDASLLPAAAGSIVVDQGGSSPETVVISTIDRTNGVITFAPALAANHSAGAIVRASGVTARFVRQRTEAIAGDTHPDFVRRMWQGDEIRGSGIGTSKETFGSRSDLDIRQLKDYVDFLSSQLRELKFGNPRSDITSTAPPSTFSSTRYFDKAGSVTGARSNTVSIGNGTTSFGDFNGTTDSVFTAAVAALPASGGQIFVKAGTYTFGSMVTLNKAVEFIGEHRLTTTIVSNVGANPLFDINERCLFKNIALSVGTGQATILDVGGTGATTYFDKAIVTGRILTSGTPSIHAQNSAFSPSGVGIESILCSSAPLLTSEFINCTFAPATGVVPAINGRLSNVTFLSCIFGCTAAYALAFTGSSDSIRVKDCDFTGAVASQSGGTVSNFVIRDSIVSQATLGTIHTFDLSDVSSFVASGLAVTYTAHASSSGLPGVCFDFIGGSGDFTIDNSTFTPPSGAWFECIRVNGSTNLSMRKCVVHRPFKGVNVFSGAGNITIDDCVFNGQTQNDTDMYGAWVDSFSGIFKFCNNTVTNFNGSSASGLNIRQAVRLESTSSVGKIVINNNYLSGIGSSSIDNAAGIWFENVGTSLYSAVISGNIIRTVTGDVGSYGIRLQADSTGVNYANISGNTIETVSGLESAYGIYASTFPNLAISGNVIRSVATTGADQLSGGIKLVSCDLAVVQGNALTGVVAAGMTSTTRNAGIAVDSCSNCVISSNSLDQNSSTGVPYGVYFTWASDDSTHDVKIINNHVALGHSSLACYGVRGAPPASTAAITDVDVSGNTIDGVRGGGWGVRVELGEASLNILVSRNTILETSYNDLNSGIRVLGVTANHTKMVTVSDNIIRGQKATTGVGAVTHVAIEVAYCDKVMISNNNCDWNDSVSTVTGLGIYVYEGIWGSVLGNRVTPDGGGNAEITVDDGTFTDAIVDSNMIGNAGTNGTLSPAPGAEPTDFTYGTNKRNT